MRYETMTMVQLDAEHRKLIGERAKLKADLRELCGVRDARLMFEAVQAKVSSMSDSEKALLRQTLQAEGIASGENVGEPGG